MRLRALSIAMSLVLLGLFGWAMPARAAYNIQPVVSAFHSGQTLYVAPGAQVPGSVAEALRSRLQSGDKIHIAMLPVDAVSSSAQGNALADDVGAQVPNAIVAIATIHGFSAFGPSGIIPGWSIGTLANNAGTAGSRVTVKLEKFIDNVHYAEAHPQSGVASSPGLRPTQTSPKSSHVGLIVGLVFAGLGVIVLIMLLSVWTRRRRVDTDRRSEVEANLSEARSRSYSFSTNTLSDSESAVSVVNLLLSAENLLKKARTNQALDAAQQKIDAANKAMDMASQSTQTPEPKIKATRATKTKEPETEMATIKPPRIGKGKRPKTAPPAQPTTVVVSNQSMGWSPYSYGNYNTWWPGGWYGGSYIWPGYMYGGDPLYNLLMADAIMDTFDRDDYQNQGYDPDYQGQAPADDTGGSWDSGQGAQDTGGSWDDQTSTPVDTGGSWGSDSGSVDTGGSWDSGGGSVDTGGGWDSGGGYDSGGGFDSGGGGDGGGGW